MVLYLWGCWVASSSRKHRSSVVHRGLRCGTWNGAVSSCSAEAPQSCWPSPEMSDTAAWSGEGWSRPPSSEGSPCGPTTSPPRSDRVRWYGWRCPTWSWWSRLFSGQQVSSSAWCRESRGCRCCSCAGQRGGLKRRHWRGVWVRLRWGSCSHCRPRCAGSRGEGTCCWCSLASESEKALSSPSASHGPAVLLSPLRPAGQQEKRIDFYICLFTPEGVAKITDNYVTLMAIDWLFWWHWYSAKQGVHKTNSSRHWLYSGLYSSAPVSLWQACTTLYVAEYLGSKHFKHSETRNLKKWI